MSTEPISVDELATDPLTLEVIKNALGSVADEMALMVMRSAYSPVVRDTMDYSTALCDRRGQVIAQGLTLAVQLGTFPTAMRHLLAEFGETAQPGDVYITNDPYGAGGQHLPDIYVVKPIFVDDELEGWAATMAHHSDVGGITPGSVAVHATEIYQEGLRMPLLKLFDAGEENTTLFRVIEKNTRQPVAVLGDLRAQVAACRAGEHGLTDIVRRYGSTTTHVYTDELQSLGERLMRAEIAALPDGEYRFVDWIDGVGDEPRPLRIEALLTIAGDELSIDFSGTSSQVEASINCPVGLVFAACYCAIKGIAGREIPNCEGYMRPIRIHAPEGTILNPVLPAACGARGVVGYRVYDTIMGALAQVTPERVMAAGDGGPTLIAFGGYEDGRPFVLTEVIVGTWGARAGQDGLEGVSNPLANLSNQPVELVESDLPLEVVRYELVPDSGGAGRFRGGLAYVREFRLLAKQAVLTIRSDRRLHPPYGLFGGSAGGASDNVMLRGDDAQQVPGMPMAAIAVRKGDTYRHVSAGGGGYGSPLDRDPAAVLEDVLDGKVTFAAARDLYGVVLSLDPPSVDESGTAARRLSLAGPPGEVPP